MASRTFSSTPRSTAVPPLALGACLLILAIVPPRMLSAANEQLQVVVLDKETRQPIACRMHLKNAAGRPRLPKKVASWDDHFAIPGKIGLELPLGNYAFDVERGLEYLVTQGHFTINKFADDSKEIEMQRFIDMAGDGWWSGDLDVRRPVRDIEVLMQAEDLHLVPLQTWWNGHSEWTGRTRVEKTLVSFDKNRCYHLMAGAQARAGGTLLYFNLPSPLRLADADAEYPPVSRFVEQARKQGKVWIDASRPYWWDLPAWVAHREIDSIQVLNGNTCRNKTIGDEGDGKPRDVKRFPSPWGNAQWSQEIYFHLLNCGIPIVPTAGSGSGVTPNPVGYNRVYVHIDGPFSSEKWWEGLRAGRVVLTNGPLLQPSVNGQPPGAVFRADKGAELEFEIGLTLSIRDPEENPISYLEVIQNGEVAHSIRFRDYVKSGKLPKVRFAQSGWFLIRARTDVRATYRFAMTGPYFVEIGYDRAVSKRSAQFFLDWVFERARQIKLEDPDQRRELLLYHREARDFWQNLLSKANRE